MALAETKLRYLLKKAQTAILKTGVPATISSLRTALDKAGNFLAPTLKVFYQGFRKPLKVDKHNEMLSSIGEDLDVLQEEFYVQALGSLRLLDRDDLLLRRIMHAARTTNDLLEFELLTLTGASGYFFNVFDTFRDLTKIDLAQTNAEVDLGTESIRLPRDTGNGTRLRLQHLTLLQEAPFRVVGDAVRSRTVPGAWFYNCFDDLSTAWQQEIITNNASGVVGEITFPLAPNEEEETFSAIYLEPMVRGVVGVEVFYSTDLVTYTKLSTPSSANLNGTKIRISTLATSAKALRIRLSKNAPDRQEADGTSVYYIGLKSIEVHREGYKQEATLVSIPLEPQDSSLLSTIDKVSLTVEEELPPGTDIEYYVAPGADATFFRLSPINRPRDDIPAVLALNRIRTVPAFNNLVTIDAIQSSGVPAQHTFPDGAATRNGIAFFDIYDLGETAEFGSVRMFRALDAWHILNREDRPETKTEADNFIVFKNDDNAQDLYVNVESELITDHTVSGTNSVKIRTRFPIVEEQSFREFAEAGSHAQRPDYLIGRIILRPGGSVTSSGRGQPLYFENAAGEFRARVYVAGDGLFQAGAKILEILRQVSSPTAGSLADEYPLRRLVGQGVRLSYTYGTVVINKVFTILQVYDFPTEKKVLLTLDDIDDDVRNSSGTLTATIQSLDVTADISTVDTDGFYLSNTVEILRADQFIVDYRRALTADDELLIDSVVVRDSIGGQITYLEGRDFTLDAATKTIYRDPQGTIRPGPSGQVSVRASFRYTRRNRDRYLYETFITVPGRDVLALDTAGLTLIEREAATLYLSSGPVNLASPQRIQLPPGTHRVEVSSKPHLLPSGTLDTASAIYKVVNLEDGDGETIFSPRRYFDRQEGILEPLQEISFARLVNSVRKGDHRFFAVLDDIIVLNYDPTTADDVLYLLPGESLERRAEKFAIGYSTFPESEEAVEQLIFKAILRKSPTAAPESTPVLSSYQLRISNG
jgi:hypothetical protein